METQISTLERILGAAQEEFLEKGYKGAALREIARKAGVTTGALYGYFQSKEDLFASLVDTEYRYLLNIYDDVLEQFHALPLSEQAENMARYSLQAMERMTNYIYDHWVSFRLILCRSEGTQYSGLVEEMARRDVQATDDFSRTSRDAGISLPPVNATLEQMLTRSLFGTYFEMVRQDLPREETGAYTSQLLQFFTGGWEKLWSL